MGTTPQHPTKAADLRLCQDVILADGVRLTVATKTESTHRDRHGDPQVRITSHHGLTVHLNADDDVTVVAW